VNTKLLIQQVDKLFQDRMTFTTFLQDVAENFYPERADFTLKRYMGDDFAANLTTTYPVMIRREMGDSFGSMLRPTSKPWFHMETVGDVPDLEAKQWLEWAEKRQRNAMYDRNTHFTRAMKEGDHDFAAFGQTAISIRLNQQRTGLLYRCFHLRDMVWMEDDAGNIILVARKMMKWDKDLYDKFGDKNHSSVKKNATKKPFNETKCYHIMIAADYYDESANGKPWFSIYHDVDHNTTLESIAVYNKEYVIPRWQTVSGSQYAYSPATVVGLPEARLLQAMTYTLLEAGEKTTNPPMVATHDAVRDDIAIYAGGVTWVDAEYDERTGDAIRPLNQNYSGMPIGLDMMRDSRQLLAHAFYLNKLTLPQMGHEMTAYEVGQRVQEYIRGALPLFEPMEMDYNGQVCDETFNVMMRAGGFGSPYNIPKSLQNRDIQYRFTSPLHDAIEAQDGQKFAMMGQMITEAMQLDPTVAAIPDVSTALKEALLGIKTPSKWLNTDDKIAEKVAEMKQAQQTAMQLQAAQQGSQAAANVGKASKDLAQA